MTGNIIGESISKYVKDQISQRQKLHGSGFNGERSLEDINYLNSNTSWIKMVSSVKIKSDSEQLDAKEPEGLKRLSDIGLNPETYSGDSLAKSAVLFRSTSQFNIEEKTQTDARTNVDFTSYESKGYTFGSGFNQDPQNIWNTKKSYGLGGLEFGIQPPPGIISFSVNHLNRGSIRKGVVNLKAYNKVQFEIIELLYLRLGFTMFIEWGNSIFIDNEGNRDNVTNTLIEDFWFKNSSKENYQEILKQINTTRKKFSGNYDGFCGRVVNFNWSFSPDGSYDINIELASLGDVIESLTINNFYYNDSYKYSSDKSDSSTNIISSFFDSIRQNKEILRLKEKQTEVDPSFNPSLFKKINKQIKEIREGDLEKEIKEYKNYAAECIDFSQLTTKEGFNSEWWPDGDKPDNTYGYFIKFGAFLNFIQEKILPRISNDKIPIIKIKNDIDTNFMYCNPLQFAIDPKICFVRNDSLPSFTNSQFTYRNVFRRGATETSDNTTATNIKNINKYFDPWLIDYDNNGQYLGSIMNIYLNFAFVEKLLKSLQQKNTKKITLYNFLENICSGINTSLGGLNKLEPVIDEDSNSITFIDSALNSLPLLENINELGSSENTFEIYGYNPDNSTSNFVKDFNFQTEIDPKLATIMTIGATSVGSVVGEDATAFSQWNKGLIDKYNPKILEPATISDFQKNQKDNTFKVKTPKEINMLKNREKQQYFRDLNKFRTEKRLKNEVEYNRSNFSGYLVECFGGGTNGANGEVITISKGVAKYADFDDDNFVSRGFTVIKNNVESIQKQLKKSEGEIQSTIGFIPVRLSLTIDGLSGIKIYNKLIFNTKFLPSNYPDSIEFLVTQVNHELQDNKWITKLETISVPKQTKVSIKKLLSEIGEEFINFGGGDAVRIPIDELKPSSSILEEIKKKEGFRAEAYDDEQPNKKLSKGDKILGTLTIGYGTTEIPYNNPVPEILSLVKGINYKKGKVQIGNKITKSTANLFFDNYIKNQQVTIKRWLKVPLTQNEYDALISFTYNAGPGASNKKTFVGLLNNKDYVGAGNALLLYNKSEGQVNPGLVRRRREELELWMRNNPGNPK